MDFNTVDLTATIAEMPPVDTQMGRAGLVEYGNSDDIVVWIERKATSLSLIQTAARGAPGGAIGGSTRDLFPVKMVHLPIEEGIARDSILGRRKFGTNNEMESYEDKANELMANGNMRFDLTEEQHRIDMLRGVVFDADRTKELYNFYNFFDIAENVFDFGVKSSGTKLLERSHKAVRAMRKEMGGLVARGYKAYCGPSFFDALVTHGDYEKAKLNTARAPELLDSVNRARVGLIEFEEYTFEANGEPALSDWECRIFPVGVPGMLLGRYGPATFESASGVQPRYAQMVPRPRGTGVDVFMEANWLHINTRPRAVLNSTAPA